jgi:hypothetical protein
MVQKVEVVISGGAVQDVICPRDVRVIVRDYDVEGVDESNTSWDIRRDSEGDLYQRMEFRHPKDEAGSKAGRATRKKPRTRKETRPPKGSRASK